ALKQVWASRGWQARCLTPISFLFFCLVRLRSTLYKLGLLKTNTFSVPVIVVGNISVGGTGKTPMVISVIKKLKAAGYHPGIVSRGYGAMPAKEPRAVSYETPAQLAGDEPLLLARDTQVPVCICADRSAAVQYLIDTNSVDVVVSDDGMQHYAMHRDIEIAVIDGQRQLGNGWLMPAGPLREPPKRLHSTNLIVLQQTADTKAAARHFHLEIAAVRKLSNGSEVKLNDWRDKEIHAMAGLGNPQRFFNSVRAYAKTVHEHAMPDHHQYVSTDLD
ncbi:UNVERIFIED_CONTAM: hypothetical protein GTU68_019828, partial [Idotea baltica]|nr:hypothetical protein [Idotea baltica]